MIMIENHNDDDDDDDDDDLLGKNDDLGMCGMMVIVRKSLIKVYN